MNTSASLVDLYPNSFMKEVVKDSNCLESKSKRMNGCGSSRDRHGRAITSFQSTELLESESIETLPELSSLLSVDAESGATILTLQHDESVLTQDEVWPVTTHSLFQEDPTLSTMDYLFPTPIESNANSNAFHPFPLAPPPTATCTDHWIAHSLHDTCMPPFTAQHQCLLNRLYEIGDVTTTLKEARPGSLDLLAPLWMERASDEKRMIEPFSRKRIHLGLVEGKRLESELNQQESAGFIRRRRGRRKQALLQHKHVQQRRPLPMNGTDLAQQMQKSVHAVMCSLPHFLP